MNLNNFKSKQENIIIVFENTKFRLFYKSFQYIALILITSILYKGVNAQDFTYSGILQEYGLLDIIDGSDATPAFADIDGDGDLDLYVGEYDGNINVFTNDGNWVFTDAGNLKDVYGVVIDVGTRIAPVFADIDGDNDLDLYIGESDGRIFVYLNYGNGNFSYLSTLQADGLTIDVTFDAKPVFADIDGDNDLDLYVGEDSGYIHVFLNDGSGKFSSAGFLYADGEIINNYQAGSFCSPDFADIDNDNDLDLYVGSHSGSIVVFLNDGSGNFSLYGDLEADGSFIDVGYHSYTEFLDYDNDDDQDLFVGSSDGKIYIYLNDGNGNFSSSGNIKAYTYKDIVVGEFSSPEFGDIDNDNDKDLLIGEYDGTINLFTNDGTGRFVSQGNLQADNVDIDVDRYSVPVLVDLDEDNDFDLYVGNINGNIKVYKNDGTGVFSYQGNLQSAGSDIDVGSLSNPEFEDLDNDNDSDLFVSSHNNDYIYHYLNDGNGNLISNGILTADGEYISINMPSFIFEDLDNDNDLDLYIGDFNGYINVFINDGSGNFSSAGRLQADNIDIDVGNRAAPEFENFNGDCFPELYIGNQDGTIKVYKGIDITDPLITSTHINQTLDADENCEASLPDYTGDVTATDNCDANLDVTQNPVAGTNISGVTNEITLTVTDDEGNTDQVTFNVSVEDNINPEITSIHNDQTIGVDANCEASLPDYTGDVTSTDNCDNNLDITQNPIAGTTISGEINEITLTVTDDAGNTDQVTFNAEVIDNTNPVIVCVGNKTVTADETHFYTVDGTEFDPTEILDNCGVASIWNDFNSLSTLANAQLPEGITTIIWLITDDAGNENTCNFDVTVNAYVAIKSLQQQGFLLYPNPTNGEIYIEINKNSIQKITISDITGKQIIQDTGIRQKETMLYTIDLSELKRGVYIIRIQTDEEIFTSKIIKR